MRIDMRRRAPNKVTESVHLPRDLSGYGVRVVFIDDLIETNPIAVSERPLAKIEVQAGAQACVRSRILRCCWRGGPSHHKACTGENALLMRLYDAIVHAGTLPEIVGVDDNESHRRLVMSGNPKVPKQLAQNCFSAEVFLRDSVRRVGMLRVIGLDRFESRK